MEFCKRRQGNFYFVLITVLLAMAFVIERARLSKQENQTTNGYQ